MVFPYSHELEENLTLMEFALSTITAAPVFGVIGGSAKVALGTVQATSALGISLISVIGKATCYKNILYERAIPHIFHGLGNMAAGVLEAIPLIGTISGCIRFCHKSDGTFGSLQTMNYLAYKCVYPEPSNSFLPLCKL